MEERVQIRIADWVNAYLQTAAGRAELEAQMRRYMELDWGYPAYIDDTYRLRLENTRYAWPTPTPEDLERAERERREREERKRLANERAEALLLEKLTPDQAATWREQRWIDVKGGQTGHTYRIRGHDPSMNIDCREDRLAYCAYPDNAHETPMADVVLAQMLWLTCDERGFLAKTNRSVMWRWYPDWGTSPSPAESTATIAAETITPDRCRTLGCELMFRFNPLTRCYVIYHNGAMVLEVAHLTTHPEGVLAAIRDRLTYELHHD